MARTETSDFLQAHTFWLVDVAPISPLSLPIFDPMAGFKSCTAPEISLDFETIKEGNWIFDKKVVKGGSCSPIVLERGVSYSDSDFWRWTITALTGDMSRISEGGPVPLLTYGGPTYRRDLLLIHFFNRMFGDGAKDFFSGNRLGKATRTALTAGAVTLGSGVLAGAALGGALTAYGAAVGMGGLTHWEFAPRVPARAYYLHNCIPSRYKVGSDFDAMSADISISELELQPEMIEPLVLTVI